MRIPFAVAGYLSILAAAIPAHSQSFAELRVDKISGGHKFVDGPVWSHEGFLAFSDVPTQQTLKFVPGKGTEVLQAKNAGASGHAYDPQGRLYTCESQGRRLIRVDKKGKTEVLAERFEGKRLNAPNDVAVSKNGHVYFTDPAFGAEQEGRELDFFGIFHLRPKGEMELAAKLRERPNGIALSPDGKVLYVANSDDRSVLAFDVDKNGSVANQRVFVSGLEGPPAGLTTDEKGNLYVACRKLEVLSPQGKPLASIQIPETPSNCAFGDPDLQTLYITARTSVYRIRLDVKGHITY